MNIIDSYQFGQVIVNGQSYTSDVVISPDGVKDNWWRKKGHHLHVDDLNEVIAEKPEVLVVGTGAYGLVKVSPEARQFLAAQGIELITKSTSETCQTYAQLCRTRRVVAPLHLTC